MQNNFLDTDTIVAVATPPGVGAIAVVRLSGKDALAMVAGFFSKKSIAQAPGYSIHYGKLWLNGELLDEVLVSIFKAPHSYTGEDVVEISLHGSPYIVEQTVGLALKAGARLAQPGEFTLRAFRNGKLDLAQAEAVADLIQSQTAAAHRVAMHQLRGGFSADIARLRQGLIDFASLVELELDFSEEDVEFADRSALKNTLENTIAYIQKLIHSFKAGNAIKNGIPVVIAGRPNAGKSTLLNALLNEEKAIVSDIPGTTRDFIEDTVVLQGIAFRFIDTAGIRHTQDQIEAMGVARTLQKMESAHLIIYLFDAANTTPQDLLIELNELKTTEKPYLLVANKLDAVDEAKGKHLQSVAGEDMVFISAANKLNLDLLRQAIIQKSGIGVANMGDVIVTNQRHVQALQKALDALNNTLQALTSGLTSDLLAEELRQALLALGEITGAITTDDVLGNIFSRFCIGK